MVRRFATSEGATPRTRSESLWLPAALLATLALLISALQALGSEPQLQWQRAKLPHRASPRSTFAPQQQVIRQVAYHDGTWHAAGAQYDTGVQPAQAVTPFRDDPANSSDLSSELAQPFGDPGRGIEEMPEPQVDQRDLSLEPVDEQPDTSVLTPPDTQDEGRDEDMNSLLEQQAPRTGVEQPRGEQPATQVDPFDQRPEFPRSSGPDVRLPSPDTQPTEREAEQLAKEEDRSEKACGEELAKIKAKRLDSVDLSIRISGLAGRDYPFECTLQDGSMLSPRCWSQVTYMWKASAQCHKPLYFEDEALERYGHSWGPAIQPIISGAHFFSRLPVLPYCMGLTPPNECIYPLGHYRPGDCAPYMIDPIPFTWRAALFEAGAWTAGAAIIP